MKKTFFKLTAVSALTLVPYFLIYALWGAILREVENQNLRFFLGGIMVCFVYTLLLLYFFKIRGGVGENEVREDYKEERYVSLLDDVKRIMKREKRIFIITSVVAVSCFALNIINGLIFEKSILNLINVLYMPMNMFTTIFSFKLFGHIIAVAVDIFFYCLLLALWRRKKYKYWFEDNNDK